jgi:hypothetical protein
MIEGEKGKPNLFSFEIVYNISFHHHPTTFPCLDFSALFGEETFFVSGAQRFDTDLLLKMRKKVEMSGLNFKNQIRILELGKLDNNSQQQSLEKALTHSHDHNKRTFQLYF